MNELDEAALDANAPKFWNRTFSTVEELKEWYAKWTAGKEDMEGFEPDNDEYYTDEEIEYLTNGANNYTVYGSGEWNNPLEDMVAQLLDDEYIQISVQR